MSPEPLFLGVDLGTSALKCGLFDLAGCCFGATRIAYPTCETRGGVEQHAGDWWRALKDGVRLGAAEVDRRRIVALGVGGHAPSPVFVDAELQPVAPVLPWFDRRSATLRDRLIDRLGREPQNGPERLMAQVAARAIWLRETAPDRFGRAQCVLLSGDYLIARLTGRRVVTSTKVPDILVAADISPDLLPERVCEPGALAGRISSDVAREIGVEAGIPVIAGGLDSFLASVGSGLAKPGDACVNMGTSIVVAAVARPGVVGRFQWAGREILSRPVRPAGRILERIPILLNLSATLADLERQSEPVRLVRSVGGLAAVRGLNQLLANVLGRAIAVPQTVESGTLGGAILAATALEFCAPIEAATLMVRLVHTFEPSGDISAGYEQLTAELRSTPVRA